MAAHQPMPYRGPVKGSSRNQASKQSRQSKALDPEDLTRRLQVVLAEQKAVAERKKRARAAVEAERQANAAAAARNASVLHPGQHGIPVGPTAPSTFIQKKQITASKSHGKLISRESSEHAPKAEKLQKAGRKNSTSSSSDRNSEDAAPSNYRHVPQFAASQFARTTTVETVTEKHLLHKLSKQAMKFHMEGPNAMASMAASDLTPSEQNKALRRVQSMRERQYERNQFQHNHTLATTAEIDEKPASPATAHTFQEHRKSKEETNKVLRRRSVGAILGMMISADPEPARASLSSAENQSVATHSDVLPVNADEHRVDWTQSDEAALIQQQQQQKQQPQQQLQQPQQPMKASISQNALRKSESRWALRTKLGNLGKKSDKLSSPTEEKDEESPIESPKSPLAKAGGIFARFKR
ncbi:hypothetical protein TGAM01_v210221 [Trichoderma gamsii]|uniref:Uncharacterized protein n=1 Tax=Trichoderma gamsii TaxID=398673 RepID=A0A2P4Z9I8_9HYPO|nr:hypothetical protein TGAM01_v210221 [Trichoderma gamsii]PON20936.1 hypothetical protein TGAM01_v210221 [Trichoderma gamsii]